MFERRLEGVSHAGNWEECSKWRGQTVQRPWGEPCRTTRRSEWLVQSEQQGGDVGGRGDNLLRHWEDSAFTLSEMRKHWGLWSREVR